MWLQRETAFFINAGVLHGAWEAENSGCRFHSVVFHPRLVGGGIDSIFWQKYLQPVMDHPAMRMVRFDQRVPWGNEAVAAIEAAWQSSVEETPGYEFSVRASLSKLMFLIYSRCPLTESRPSRKILRDGERMKTMLHYIQKHYSEEMSTAQIAASAAISESECLRCFRSIIGTTPIRYVRQFRIQEAARLLNQTDQKIADIAVQCGFQEMSYFAKAFRELKGCTPTEYRKK
ncbi:helix-turn-helix transcriptional regulator [Clostridium sp. AM58-1XD]|uniref:helix-turn-helix transcriptional regulator n=1 Tax=Clostridium sp. AM58-1XD TaxID=2292307 RepID=UPI001FA87D03|nr:helix-turn-helix transcriptional regulator [Clostridium sp. AM58-1XD]